MISASCGSSLFAISDTRENTVRISSTSAMVRNSSTELSRSAPSSRSTPCACAGDRVGNISGHSRSLMGVSTAAVIRASDLSGSNERPGWATACSNVSIPSYIVDALRCWWPLFRRVSTHLRHLPRYPFTDISRAVSEFDSVGLSDDQEFHRVPIDEQNICEVDGHDATFFEHALKYVQVLGSDPTADPHDHPIVFSRESVNSEAHRSSFAPRLSIFLTS